ncbi:MAG: hypothetical protein ACREOZ_03685 [Gloeomargaritales cyanobacterium]
MGKRSEKWAARFTWRNMTYGCHSTQRAEAMNSSVASKCTARDSIRELILSLEAMASHHAMKSHTEAVRKQCESVCFQGTNMDLVEAVKDRLSHYAYQKLIEQAHHVLSCDSVSVESSGFFRVVRRKRKQADNRLFEIEHCNEIDYATPDVQQDADRLTSLTSCSCQHLSNMWLPCRHMFNVAFKIGVSEEQVRRLVLSR